MTHILGLTRRCLTLKGANAHKVEFDYLRLVYAVKELRRSNHEAKGYLLVMTPEIAKRTDAWREKYEAGNTVEVMAAPLTDEMLSVIKLEVRENIEGMVAGTIGEDVAGRSDATRGRRLAERLLVELIERKEPRLTRQTDKIRYPFGIQWDYYGTDNLH